MPASTQEKSRPDTGQQTGLYVYGIVPGDVKLNSGVHGVGEPPGQIRLVRSGDLAALVSEVDITKPLGTPEEFAALIAADSKRWGDVIRQGGIKLESN